MFVSVEFSPFFLYILRNDHLQLKADLNVRYVFYVIYWRRREQMSQNVLVFQIF